jgi:hypothetical protein
MTICDHIDRSVQSANMATFYSKTCARDTYSIGKQLVYAREVVYWTSLVLRSADVSGQIASQITNF